MYAALKISWLSYINSALENVYKVTISSEISKTLMYTKKEIKNTFLELRLDLRSKAEKDKSIVVQYISNSIEASTKKYLSYVAYAHHLFVLIRLRCGIAHYLVAFPTMRIHPPEDMPCPCDNRSKQSTMHFLLFCNFYKNFRCFYLKPLFLTHHIRSHKEALKFLVTLGDPLTCYGVALFILKAIKMRKNMSI